MKAVLVALLASLLAGFQSRAALQLEVLALRHQLAVHQRRHQRARTQVVDRLLWAWLSRTWAGWREVLVFVSRAPSSLGNGAGSATIGLVSPAVRQAGPRSARRSRI